MSAIESMSSGPHRTIRGSLQSFWRRIVFIVVALAACSVPFHARAANGPVWARVELVENTAEGPAYDRCGMETLLAGPRSNRWRLFYGEARADSGAGWTAIRSRSGCAAVAAEDDPGPWVLRGSPYFLVDVVLGPATSSRRETRLDATLTVRKLTGFASDGAPTYDRRTERRSFRVPEGDVAIAPVLIADQEETDQFRVRELLLRFHAIDLGSRPEAKYGELAVSADVPRADILLDGGFVGRTSYEGPVLLGVVRAGEREIVGRDSSGREARTVARVRKGRRTDVALTLLPASDPSRSGELRPVGRNPQGGEEFWRGKDGAIVVRIPGGEFQMGSPEGFGEPSEHPQHAVRVRGFFMDKTEVTWGQYRRFAKETGRKLPASPVWGTPEDYAASNLTWSDAAAFCAWVGGRLPTEAEWERAARGDDGRRYPWGDEADPSRCNTQEGGPHRPVAVASYPDCVSRQGVLDLVGSVWEWCSDWYDESYYASSPPDNPTGPETGRTRVSRGGSWVNPLSWARNAYRQGIDPTWPESLRGVRCVHDDSGGASE